MNLTRTMECQTSQMKNVSSVSVSFFSVIDHVNLLKIWLMHLLTLLRDASDSLKYTHIKVRWLTMDGQCLHTVYHLKNVILVR